MAEENVLQREVVVGAETYSSAQPITVIPNWWELCGLTEVHLLMANNMYLSKPSKATEQFYANTHRSRRGRLRATNSELEIEC